MKIRWRHITVFALSLILFGAAVICFPILRKPSYVASTSTTAEPDKLPVVVPPPPPELPEYRDAYIGYEPIRHMSSPGDAWYYQGALRVNGSTIELYKSPVSCQNNELSWSASDGGFFWYQGKINENGIATLTLLKCDYCLEPAAHSGKTGIIREQISYPSPGTVQLGKVVYSRAISPHSRLCP